jgi:hypothetical protein
MSHKETIAALQRLQEKGGLGPAAHQAIDNALAQLQHAAPLELKYFVLKPSGDDVYAQASRMALYTYAAAIEGENPVLAEQLVQWQRREAQAAIKRRLDTEELRAEQRAIKVREEWDRRDAAADAARLAVESKYPQDLRSRLARLLWRNAPHGCEVRELSVAEVRAELNAVQPDGWTAADSLLASCVQRELESLGSGEILPVDDLWRVLRDTDPSTLRGQLCALLSKSGEMIDVHAVKAILREAPVNEQPLIKAAYAWLDSYPTALRVPSSTLRLILNDEENR